MLELREYQVEMVNKARSAMAAGHKRILIESPTGSGKTVIAAYMLQQCENKGMRAFFNMHRRELVKQTAKTLVKHDTNFGIIASGFVREEEPLIQIASIGTLARRLDKIQVPQLIIWDEAHHIAAASWDKIFQKYPDAFHILLTATPERLDGKGLKGYADIMIKGPKIKWLIEQGYLCDYVAYEPNQVDMGGVHTVRGDYNSKEAAELIDKPTITGSAVSEYLKFLKGKPAVIFAITIEHSENVVAEFNKAGITAAHIDGKTPAKIRDMLLDRFAKGEIQVVSNVGLFGEGFDLPKLEGLFMLKPTQSLSLYLQMCGRVLRAAENKDRAFIFDHVGNMRRHGLPCDERDWNLNGREKKKRGNNSAPPVKICEACFAGQPPRSDRCIYCGAKFEIKQRDIQEVEGMLAEIDKENFRKQQRKAQGSSKTLDDLIKLGKARGYKNPHAWAKHVFNGRRNRK